MNVFDLLATLSFISAVVSLYVMFAFDFLSGFASVLIAAAQTVAWNRVGEIEKEIERLKESH